MDYKQSNGWDHRALQLCSWMASRVSGVCLQLPKYNLPIPDSAENILNIDGGWQKVSVYVFYENKYSLLLQSGTKYNMPSIRHRPAYPNLKYETGSDSQKRGGSCNKYFNEYGKTGLTGGIMCAWCTHSICYGFHCIPNSEGRNDVFSAMVTRWPKAPKYVIYDFACQLAPYCRT